MTQQFRINTKALMILILTASFLLYGCAGAPTGLSFDFLNVDVIHKIDDPYMKQNLPRDITEPEKGFHSIERGEELTLKATENSGILVTTWEIQDYFGNTMNTINSPGTLTVRVNHKLVANIKCATNDACIAGYSCVNGNCQHG